MKIQKLISDLFPGGPKNTNNYLRYKDSNRLIHQADVEKLIAGKREFDEKTSPGIKMPFVTNGKKKHGVWEIF